MYERTRYVYAMHLIIHARTRSGTPFVHIYSCMSVHAMCTYRRQSYTLIHILATKNLAPEKEWLKTRRGEEARCLNCKTEERFAPQKLAARQFIK
jgi:hypothetical protein